MLTGQQIIMTSVLVVVAAAGASAIFSPCFGVFSSYERWFESAPDPGQPISRVREQLQDSGNDLIRGIRDFERRHGRFPCSLDEADLKAPWTSWGSVRYAVVPATRGGDPERFVLRITPSRKSPKVVEYDSVLDKWSLRE